MLSGVDHHGQRGRRALIAAAGDDDHGQGAAAHARVGRGGGVGLQELAVLAVELADVDAPAVRQALLRDFQIAVDLALQDGLNVLEVAGLGKIQNSGDGQAAVIGHAVARSRLVLGAEEKRAVLFDADNVCMGIFQLDERRMWAAEHLGDQA